MTGLSAGLALLGIACAAADPSQTEFDQAADDAESALDAAIDRGPRPDAGGGADTGTGDRPVDTAVDSVQGEQGYADAPDARPADGPFDSPFDSHSPDTRTAEAPPSACKARAPGKSSLTFFLTSRGMGKGANLGGLAGADAFCQTLAANVGAGDYTWRAYLSVTGPPAINARDRIGCGPWVSTKGEIVIAKDVDDLHGAGNMISKSAARDNNGALIHGFTDTPNLHDMLTGSMEDGRAFPPGEDHTCSDWTSGAIGGKARVGHHDKTGSDPGAKSWNSAHDSNGCSAAKLQETGGGGRFYCFAVDSRKKWWRLGRQGRSIPHRP